MKCLVYFFMVVLQYTTFYAQSNLGVEEELARAGLHHLQKDYSKAIHSYEAAFKAKDPDSSSAYKAAGVYSLAGNEERSFYFLHVAVKEGWMETSWLTYDPYFDYLRQTNPVEWEKVVSLVKENEKAYEKKLAKPELRQKINLMVLSDQQLRYRKAQTQDPKEVRSIDQAIAASDKKNWLEVKRIITDCGWPKISDIGKDGQNNLWLIVQHADHDITFQREVLKKMELLLKSNEINLENYAFLSDRVLCNLNYLQKYGTQVNWTTNGMASSFRDIRDEWKTDKRRRKLGLTNLATYALIYGFKYRKPTKKDYKQARKRVEKKVKVLVNNALTAYKAGDFQRTYDSYNSASTFAEGMSDHQSLKAAKVFSIIATKVEDNQKYKDISFDFLNLLNLRNKLNKISIKEMQEFKILHRDPRWIILFHSMSDK